MNFNLYTVKRKHFLSRTYEILDRSQTLYCTARRPFFKTAFTLRDDTGKVVFVIKRKFAFFKFRFLIYHNDELYAEIESKRSMKTRLEIETGEGMYYIDGKFFNREFTIFRETNEVAKVSRKVSINSRMGIAIKEGEDDEFILTLVLVVELMLLIKRSRNS